MAHENRCPLLTCTKIPGGGTLERNLINDAQRSLSPWTGQEEYNQISLGIEHACAIDIDKQVSCWHFGTDLGSAVVPLGLFAA